MQLVRLLLLRLDGVRLQQTLGLQQLEQVQVLQPIGLLLLVNMQEQLQTILLHLVIDRTPKGNTQYASVLLQMVKPVALR